VTKKEIDSKRIIVTGGAGFIGSNLCDGLISQGHEVLCVDNFFSGKKENISHLLENPRFEFIRHDITFPLYLEADLIFRSGPHISSSLSRVSRSLRPRPGSDC
jgi:UDP-glucuronate decarboxylase